MSYPIETQFFLKLPDCSAEMRVQSCDECRGIIHHEDVDWIKSLPIVMDAQLLDSDRKVFWEGRLKFSENRGQFDLLIDHPDEECIFLWKELPSALSLFDGGYIYLEERLRNEYLEDILTYWNLVEGRLHFKSGLTEEWRKVTVPNQESLKVVTELLCIPETDLSLSNDSFCVLELDLFEQTVFIVTTVEDQEDGQFVFRLTDHIYLSKRRAGVRVKVEPSLQNFHNYKLLEVSDFGMKIETAESVTWPSTATKIPVGGVEIPFEVIFSKRQADGTVIHGLRIADQSIRAKKNWQRFLLPFQFPKLRYRTKEYHQKFWELYYRTGYMEFNYTKYLEEAKEQVFRTWETIDEIGPFLGSSVFALEEEDLVSSIGVAHVGGGVYVAQSANTVAQPKFLPHTRSMYSWRTRFIMQQHDSYGHLAFIHRDKKFLDRFFRSFYLKKKDPEIVWDEWNLFVLKNSDPAPDLNTKQPAMNEERSTETRGKTLLELLGSIKGGNFELQNTSDGSIVNAVPHLHMMQYLTGVWSPNGTLNPAKKFSRENVFFSYYTKLETELSRESLLKFWADADIVHEGWHVTWLCPRRLLNSFLSNSLKSLEIMNRKYKGSSAA